MGLFRWVIDHSVTEKHVTTRRTPCITVRHQFSGPRTVNPGASAIPVVYCAGQRAIRMICTPSRIEDTLPRQGGTAGSFNAWLTGGSLLTPLLRNFVGDHNVLSLQRKLRTLFIKA